MENLNLPVGLNLMTLQEITNNIKNSIIYKLYPMLNNRKRKTIMSRAEY